VWLPAALRPVTTFFFTLASPAIIFASHQSAGYAYEQLLKRPFESVFGQKRTDFGQFRTFFDLNQCLGLTIAFS
jgi:hypothetical protein